VISRRRFLEIAAVCGVPLAAGSLASDGWLAWFGSRASRRLLALARSPEERLRNHFAYLDLEPEGVARYFADCARYRAGFSRYVPFPPEIYTNYLLSTDFFKNGADESQLVRYVGFYDPAVTPCSNPLAQFDDQPDA
jgi:hypothetical protein